MQSNGIGDRPMNERAVSSQRMAQGGGRQMLAPAATPGLPAVGDVANRRVAIVLGMHRSGTSLLSNVMHYLGCDMADTTDAISDKNPGGFWERPQIVALHDEILEAIDRGIGTPQHVLPFPAGWWRRKEIKPIKQRLIEYVADSLATTTDLWGFKDPRMCRMLPLWKEILRAVGADPVYVHAIRAPEPAARSMSLKNTKLRPLTDAQSEMMWLAYNYDIVRYTTSQNVLVVDYDHWFDAPTDIAVRLLDHLGLPNDLSYDEIRKLVGGLVSSDFRNQRDDPASVNPTIARSFYEAMRDSGRDPDIRTVEQQLPFIDLMFRSIEPLIGQLREIPELRSAVTRGEEAVRELDVRMRQIVDLKRERNEAGVSSQNAAAEAKAREEQLRRLEASADEFAEKEKRLSDEIERLAAEAKRMATEREASERALHDRLSAQDLAREEVYAQRIAGLEKTISEVRAGEEAARRVATEEAARATDLTTKLDSMMAVSVDQVRSLFEQSLASMTELLALRDVAERNRSLESECRALRAFGEARVPQQRLDHARQRARSLVAALRNARKSLESLALVKAAEAEAREELRSARYDLDLARRRIAWQEAALAERERQFLGLRDTAAVLRAEKLVIEGALARDPMRSAIVRAAPTADEVVEARFMPSDEGVSGYARLAKRPDVPLIVEGWVDGEVVTSVLTRPDGISAAPDRPFALPAGAVTISWSVFPTAASGRVLSLRLVGSTQSLVDDISIPDLSTARMRGESAMDPVYRDWLRRHWALGPAEREAARVFLKTSSDWPLVSVILLPGAAGGASAARSIGSMCGQLYENWEILVAPGLLDGENHDPRIREVAGEYLADLVGAAEGAFVSFLAEGDLLSEDALLTLAAAAKGVAADTILYADEDRFDPATANRSRPHFKGGWSLDLFLREDYIARPVWIPATLLREYARGSADAIGVYSTLLGIVSAGALGGIHHVPRILYHRSGDARTDLDAERDLITATLRQTTPLAAVVVDAVGRRTVKWPLPEPAPLISLIVPTRDRLDLLRVCVEGLLRETEYPNIELLIVDNDSAEPETHAYLRGVGRDARVKVLTWSGAFDYSAINNFAAERARGSIIGLLNNDLRIDRADWLLELARHAVRPDVGAVGARLLYADGTLQHAGIVMGIGTASHRYKGLPADHPGHCDVMLATHDVTAVTAACILIRKDVWDQVGGLSPDFPIAYNDVDLCLRIRAAGYRVVLEPAALLYHLESQSRGSDQDGEKRARLNADRDLLVARWPEAISSDPFYNPNLTVKATDAGLADPPRISWSWQVAVNVPVP